jgi:hypothetical protein
VAATAYRAAHRSQDPENQAQNDQDDAKRPKEADVEDGGKNETDDSEDYHFGFLQWKVWSGGLFTPSPEPETPLPAILAMTLA